MVETTLEGQAELETDEEHEFFAILDQTQTHLTSIEFCIATGSFAIDTHFRGFRPTFTSEDRVQSYTFGGMDPSIDECKTLQISPDEYQREIEVFSDTVDLEGFILINSNGVEREIKTNSGGTNYGRTQIKGPIIGFRVLTRREVYLAYADVYERVPIYISVLYNSCACPQSKFLGNLPPYDMETRAAQEGPQTQYLDFQKDSISSAYQSQSCGSYSVKLSPELPFITLESSGTEGPTGFPYIDMLVLGQTSIEDVGIYQIEITILQDTSQGDGYSAPTPGSLDPITYNFTVTIDPCRVSRYGIDVSPQRLTYIIGDETKTGAYYNFEEMQSFCQYPATVTVTNLPFFALHNEADQNFAVLYIDDLTLAATYQVQVKSTITFPISAEDLTETRTESAQTGFEIRLINPCKVTSIIEWKIEPIVTTVDAKPFTVELPQATDQSSLDFGNKDGYTLCGGQTYTVLSQPSSYQSYMSFDGDSTLTINPANVDDAGEKFISLRVSLTNYPDMGTLDTSLIIKIETCTVTELSFSQIPAQSYSIFTEPLQFSFVDFTQSPDCQYQLEYEVALFQGDAQYDALPAFIKMQGYTFSVESSNISNQGEYQISIRARTPVSVQTIQVEEEMLINLELLNLCDEDKSAIFSSQSDIEHNIKFSESVVVTPEWEPSTVEGCPTTYSVFLVESDGVERPLTPAETQLVEQQPSNGSIRIYNEDDLTVAGETWTIKIERDSIYSGSPNRKASIQFDIIWRYPCYEDLLTVVTVMPRTVNYLIGKTGLLSQTQEVVQSESGCPLDYKLLYIEENGETRPLGAEELSYITFNKDTRRLAILNNDNYSFHDKIWPLKFIMTSLESLREKGIAEFEFNVRWRDFCWDAKLQAAQFVQDAFTFALYDNLSVSFKSMIDLDNGYSCGGYSNAFRYLSGPAYDSTFPFGADITSQFLFSTDKLMVTLSGQIIDRNWIGTHSFQVLSGNGIYDSESDRGDFGIFGRVNSTVAFVTITDPCLTAVVNSDNGMDLPDFFTAEGVETQTSDSYTGPTNSVGYLEGSNLYTLCGPLNYAIKTVNYQPFDENWLRFVKLGDATPQDGDQFAFEVTQNVAYKRLARREFLLEISLEDYPLSTPALVPLRIWIRECEPTNLSFKKISDQQIRVGRPVIGMSLEVDQEPCVGLYKVSYFAFLKTEEGSKRAPLPSFIKLDSVSKQIFIETPQKEHIGEYKIGLLANLDDSVQTQAETTFTVRVIGDTFDEIDDGKTVVVNPESDSEYFDPGIYVLEMPDWLKNLKDQTVRLGSSLVYRMGEPLDRLDQPMTVEVDLGTALEFAYFDSVRNMIKVNSLELKTKHLGTHRVTVKASMNKDLYSKKQFKNYFYLIVLPKLDEEEDNSSIKPITINDFNGPIYESIKPAPYDAKAPVPYVFNLSVEGLLTIGWDKPMQKVISEEAIKRTKVAIRDWQHETVYLRRKLSSDELIYITDLESMKDELHMLFDSLEISLSSETQDQKLVPWSLVSSDEDFLVIKLQFEDPNSLTQIQGEPQISVAFWGVDFFKSSQGKVVRFGTSLHWKIFRQITKEEQETVEQLAFIYYALVAILLLLLPICFVGMSLPTWMFLNTLMLVAHLPLINTAMPANLHQFLKPYLDLVRLNIDGLPFTLDDAYDSTRVTLQVNDSNDIYAANNSLIQACGYGTLFINNTIVIVCLFGLFITTWGLVSIKDYCLGSCKSQLPRLLRPGHEEFMSNITVRFVYECFFELLICTLISLAFNDRSSQGAGFQWVTSLFTVLGLVALLGFLLRKLCQGGPYLEGFYEPLTVDVICCWGSRQKNSDFDEMQHLAQFEFQKNGQLPDLYDLKIDVERHMFSSASKAGGSPEPRTWLVDQINSERGLLDSPFLSLRRIRDSVTDKNSDLDDNMTSQANESRNNNMISNYNISQEAAETYNVETDLNLNVAMTDFDYLRTPQKSIDLKERISVSERTSVSVDGSNAKRVFVLSALRKSDQKEISEKEMLEGGEQQSMMFDTNHIREMAKSKLNIDDTVTVSFRYKTLFNGLKHNTQRNVAVVYPITFLLRRVLFATTIVFMNDIPYTGLFLFMGCNLAMLAYACTEHQWRDPALNWQHIFNEVALYVFCLFLVYFSIVETSVESRFTLGYVFIAVFFVWIIVNLTVILWHAARFMKQIMKRSYFRLTYGQLARKVKKVVKKLKIEMIDEENNPFRDEREQNEDGDFVVPSCVPFLERTESGGFTARLVKQREFDKLQMQSQLRVGRIVSKQFSSGRIVPIMSTISRPGTMQSAMSTQPMSPDRRTLDGRGTPLSAFEARPFSPDMFDRAQKHKRNNPFSRTQTPTPRLSLDGKESQSPYQQEGKSLESGTILKRLDQLQQLPLAPDANSKFKPKTSLQLKLQPIEENDDVASSSMSSSSKNGSKREGDDIVQELTASLRRLTPEEEAPQKQLTILLPEEIAASSAARPGEQTDEKKQREGDTNSENKEENARITLQSVARLPSRMQKQWSVGLDSSDVCTPRDKAPALFVPTNSMSVQQKTAKFYEESPVVGRENKSDFVPDSGDKNDDFDLDSSSKTSLRIKIMNSKSENEKSDQKVKEDEPVSHFKKASVVEPDPVKETTVDQTDFLTFLEHTQIEGTASVNKKDKVDTIEIIDQVEKQVEALKKFVSRRENEDEKRKGVNIVESRAVSPHPKQDNQVELRLSREEVDDPELHEHSTNSNRRRISSSISRISVNSKSIKMADTSFTNITVDRKETKKEATEETNLMLSGSQEPPEDPVLRFFKEQNEQKLTENSIRKRRGLRQQATYEDFSRVDPFDPRLNKGSASRKTEDAAAIGKSKFSFGSLTKSLTKQNFDVKQQQNLEHIDAILAQQNRPSVIDQAELGSVTNSSRPLTHARTVIGHHSNSVSGPPEEETKHLGRRSLMSPLAENKTIPVPSTGIRQPVHAGLQESRNHFKLIRGSHTAETKPQEVREDASELNELQLLKMIRESVNSQDGGRGIGSHLAFSDGDDVRSRGSYLTSPTNIKAMIDQSAASQRSKRMSYLRAGSVPSIGSFGEQPSLQLQQRATQGSLLTNPQRRAIVRQMTHATEIDEHILITLQSHGDTSGEVQVVNTHEFDHGDSVRDGISSSPQRRRLARAGTKKSLPLTATQTSDMRRQSFSNMALNQFGGSKPASHHRPMQSREFGSLTGKATVSKGSSPLRRQPILFQDYNRTTPHTNLITPELRMHPPQQQQMMHPPQNQRVTSPTSQSSGSHNKLKFNINMHRQTAQQVLRQQKSMPIQLDTNGTFDAISKEVKNDHRHFTFQRQTEENVVPPSFNMNKKSAGGEDKNQQNTRGLNAARRSQLFTLAPPETHDCLSPPKTSKTVEGRFEPSWNTNEVAKEPNPPQLPNKHTTMQPRTGFN